MHKKFIFTNRCERRPKKNRMKHCNKLFYLKWNKDRNEGKALIFYYSVIFFIPSK